MTRRDKRSNKIYIIITLKTSLLNVTRTRDDNWIKPNQIEVQPFKRKEFRDSLYEHFILLGLVIGGTYVHLEILKVELQVIRDERSGYQVLEKDNNYPVATHYTNKSPS